MSEEMDRYMRGEITAHEYIDLSRKRVKHNRKTAGQIVVSRCQAAEERAAALDARVRELEQAQGELLDALFPAKSCLTCGRAMSGEGDGLDRDCGGDCWGCMVENCPDDPDVIAWHRERMERSA